MKELIEQNKLIYGKSPLEALCIPINNMEIAKKSIKRIANNQPINKEDIKAEDLGNSFNQISPLTKEEQVLYDSLKLDIIAVAESMGITKELLEREVNPTVSSGNKLFQDKLFKDK